MPIRKRPAQSPEPGISQIDEWCEGRRPFPIALGTGKEEDMFCVAVLHTLPDGNRIGQPAVHQNPSLVMNRFCHEGEAAGCLENMEVIFPQVFLFVIEGLSRPAVGNSCY